VRKVKKEEVCRQGWRHQEGGQALSQCTPCTAIIITKKYSTSLLLEWLSSRMQTTNVDEDVGEKEPLHTVGGNIN
jgi:hypothetical protein